ncbi:MAG: mannitol dehydrogenase family protein [Rikenellaceae bacterium]
MKTTKINYNRSAVKAGILHFGVGNFHRAHLQCYTNRLLSAGNSNEWGICGAMIMNQDESLYKRLKDQQGVYSLTVCGRDGVNEVEWIGSLVDLLWSGEDKEAIINKVADPDIKIISMTITEGGYNLDTDAVRADLLFPQNPQSIFGIVAEGLRRRIAAGVGGVTILTCDNLQHNGDQCRKVFTGFFAQQDEALAAWVEQNVTFPNSMVDRITPATTEVDMARINATLDEVDKAPVYCEDYIQWVVEDNFAAGRPAWEGVGVEFTNDVAPFEKMKLSLLNAAHTLLSYPSLLSGYRKVDEAMRDEVIVKFTKEYMDLDATPYVPAPANTDLELYKNTLIERFANSAVSDQISRLCGDGASKFPVYVVPIIAQMLEAKADMSRMAYLIAAYRHYLKYLVDDKGVGYEIFEPTLSAEDLDIIVNVEPAKFLAMQSFAAVDLLAYPKFVDQYLEMVASIEQRGAMQTLLTL